MPVLPPAIKMANMDKPIFSVTPGYGEDQLREFHYSQAVRYGDRVETSGQGGWDDDWCYPESVRDEVIQAFDNVERTLATAGGSGRQVITGHSYHVVDANGRIGPEHMDTMVEQLRLRIGDRAPLWTCIGVSALAGPKMRVEIEVAAIVET
jgi:enamine deaminase RidA (YjgF/YER057c/UK114 family)